MSEFSLYRLCLWKTALLLKSSYWNETLHSNDAGNPFSFLPSSVVEDLVSCVLQLSSSGILKVTDLYHLLTSGRVKDFKLEDVLISTEDLVSVFMSLSVACQKLRSLTLRNVHCCDKYTHFAKCPITMTSEALECLLSISPHLESIESCILFNLKTIRNCERLKILKLNFVLKCKLSDFLEETNGNFWPNNTLSVLDVFENARNTLSHVEVATVLKYCPELTQIHNDISASLEYLHSDEMYNGTLSHQYKLQKCYLGNAFMPPACASASIDAVHIATLTCPLMKDIDVLVNDNAVIYALSDFQNLSSLLIQWESPIGGDYQLGFHMLFDKIGPNLKNLHVLNFFNVDFAAIATKCTQIENLKIEYHTEFKGYDSPPVSFQHLKSLHIENIDGEFGCEINTLLLLLSNCIHLSFLCIQCADNLNDDVLARILVKNSLSSLKEATILNCSLTREGVRNLAVHLKMLEYFHFSSKQVEFDEAASVVHEVNPLVIMRSDVE